jgi:hypothetical protein
VLQREPEQLEAYRFLKLYHAGGSNNRGAAAGRADEDTGWVINAFISRNGCGSFLTLSKARKTLARN